MHACVCVMYVRVCVYLCAHAYGYRSITGIFLNCFLPYLFVTGFLTEPGTQLLD